jgi:CheY-like chemotaxis protein
MTDHVPGLKSTGARTPSSDISSLLTKLNESSLGNDPPHPSEGATQVSMPSSTRRGASQEPLARGIVVVDDDPIMLAMVEDRLDQAGIPSFLVESGDELERAVRDHRPSAVLLDVSMPGLSGENPAQDMGPRLRALGVPTILHSSRDAYRLAQIANECGAIGALAKTDDDDLFLSRLNAIMDEHQKKNLD